MEIIKFLNIIGITAFSIAGAFAAMEKKFEFLGVFVIAFVTALGGGTLRDLLMGHLPVRWIYDIGQVVIVLLSALVVFYFTKLVHNFKKILLVFDSLGLAFFTVVGIQQGILLELHPWKCIALGTVTACFGGVIRDVLLNNIPLIFQKEIYASACIFGGIIYFILLNASMQAGPREAICIIVIATVRLLATRYNWQLPQLKYSQHEK